MSVVTTKSRAGHCHCQSAYHGLRGGAAALVGSRDSGWRTCVSCCRNWVTKARRAGAEGGEGGGNWRFWAGRRSAVVELVIGHDREYGSGVGGMVNAMVGILGLFA